MRIDDEPAAVKGARECSPGKGVGGITKESVINVSQVFTVDKSWLDEYCGSLSDQRMEEILEGLFLILRPARVD